MPHHLRPRLLRTALLLSIAALLGGLAALGAAPATALTPAPFVSADAQLIGVSNGATSWADYDGDGDPDLLLAGQINTGDNAYFNLTKLYRNSAGTFVDSGIALPGLLDGVTAWGDYDNDGDLDLLLAGDSAFRIYQNRGGQLADIRAGIDPLESDSAAWGDYGGDRDLDFVYGGWANGQFRATLYRNDQGAFVDSGIALPGLIRGAFAWGDYDGDGDTDLFMSGAATGGTFVARLFRNTSVSLADSGIAFPGVQDGSAAWGDYDGDGDLDLLLTGDRGSEYLTRIYRNDRGSFTNVDAGFPGIIFGQGTWVDYDGDGDLDVHLNGHALGAMVNEIYRNTGGTFSAIGAGLPLYSRKGNLWADYNLDGRPDLLAMTRLPDDSYSNQVYRSTVGAGAPPTATPTTPSGMPTATATAAPPTATPTPGPAALACPPTSGTQTPGSLSLVSRSFGGATAIGYVGDIAVQGQRVVMATDQGVQVVDAANPAQPALVTTGSNGSWGSTIAVSGTSALLNGYNYGLGTYDVADPRQPVKLGSFTTSSSMTSLNRVTDRAYVGDFGGLMLLDVANPAAPRLIGRYLQSGSGPQDTEVCGPIAYIAAGNNGLQIVSVQNPAAPEQLGVAENVWASAVETVGSVAYVAGVRGGLLLYDVRDPAAPVLLGQYNTPGDAIDVKVVGGYAYVADRWNGLVVLDVTNPRQPKLRTQLELPWAARHLEVAGDLVYVAAEGDGLYVVRIGAGGAAPSTPTPAAPPTATPAGASPTPLPGQFPTPTPTAAPVFPPGCGLSINHGATYAGQRGVQLWLDVTGAAQMQLSNDGGFAQAEWQPYASRADWTLPNPGARIATLMVYARFADAQGLPLCGGANISDDIIYDPLPPEVSATFNASAPATQLGATATAARRLRLSADDQATGSGVVELRISTDPTFTGVPWQAFSTMLPITASPNTPVYVQVRDAVQNVSAVSRVTDMFQIRLPHVRR